MRNTHVVALVHIQVCLHISLVCSPNCPRHTGPWLLEGKHALDIVSVDLFARDWIYDGGFDAEEGEGGRSRLGGRYTTERCDDVGAGLRLPVCLYISACIHLISSFLHLRPQRAPPPFRQYQSTISRPQQRSAHLQIRECGDSSSGA